MPKSSSRTRPSLSTRMLEGFRSAWATKRLWANCTTLAAWRNTTMRWLSGKGATASSSGAPFT